MEYPINQILHGDSYEILPTLPDKSFDSVIIDPPYGMGIDTWDKPVDVAFFTEQIKRIGKEFYAVFGQMPYLREWDREAERQGLKFIEHISWVKRDGTPTTRLYRSHEEIYIYAITAKHRFYSKTGRYEDVKLPGVLVDTITLEGITRYIGDLWYAIEHGEVRIKKDNEKTHSSYLRLNQSQRDMSALKRTANYTNVWSFLPSMKKNKVRSLKCHPTMKPLLLQERLVEMLTPEGGSVLDCFSGSGTTAIACQRLNRQFLAIEKEREFYEYSLERLNGDVYQPELPVNNN